MEHFPYGYVCHERPAGEDAANLILLVNLIKFLQHLEGHGNILINILHSMPHVPEHLTATGAP